MKEFESLIDLIRNLPTHEDCRKFLEELRWQGQPICPHCHEQSERHYKLTSRGIFRGLYKCHKCRKRFTVTVGTMFEGSKIPLNNWFYAIYVFISHKKGISSHQLAEDIKVTQKTAWFMLERIRHNMKGMIKVNFGDETQIDETYVGGRNKGRVKNNQGRSLKTKVPVMGLISNGMARTFVVPNTKGTILKPIVKLFVKKGTTIVTDGWGGYKGLSKDYTHKVVDHGSGEYVRDSFHTNTIEGFWSQLKRGIFGIYHHISPKHLNNYCAEFEFRYNARNIDTHTRFLMFIISAYKRIHYKTIIRPRFAWE